MNGVSFKPLLSLIAPRNAIDLIRMSASSTWMLKCFADQAFVLKVLKVNMALFTHTSFTSLSLVTLTASYISRKRS